MRRLVVGGVLLALALFLLGRFDNPASRAIREKALDLVTPAIAMAEAPVRWVRAAYDWLEGLFAVHAENARLKARLRGIEQQLAEARHLAERGQALSALLGYREAPHRLVASGRLVAFDGGAFQESALVTVGRRDGVRVDAAPQPGELVTTSGADGIFPPDLPVGRVVRRDGGDLLVEPAVAFGRLDRVVVLAAVHRALLEDDAAADHMDRPRPEDDQ